MMKTKPEYRGQKGLCLLELLIAMMITVVGVLGVVTLISYGMRMHTTSRDITAASALAKHKIEEFRLLSPYHPTLAVGGSLSASDPNHFDEIEGFVRRWQVAPGPSRTLDVTVRVMPLVQQPGSAPLDIQLLLEAN